MWKKCSTSWPKWAKHAIPSIRGPSGGVQSRNHANFSPFSRNHARFSLLSRNHTNWSHFSTFTQSRTYFFRFHAITQITQMRKGFSRHHAHQKDLSRITHTCQFHAITQLFFHFHAITQNHATKKGHSRNHANLWGASLIIIVWENFSIRHRKLSGLTQFYCLLLRHDWRKVSAQTPLLHHGWWKF